MTGVVIAQSVNYYRQRKGHFRVQERRSAPPRCAEGLAYVYLLEFADQLKVGVTTDPQARVGTHERFKRSAIKHGYFILLTRTEAFRRELVISQLLGFRAHHHSSEWLDLEHLSQAVLLLRNPEMELAIRTLRTQAMDIADNGVDPRFELIGEKRKFEVAA